MMDATSNIALMAQSFDSDSDSETLWLHFEKWAEENNISNWNYFLLPPFEDQLNNIPRQAHERSCDYLMFGPKKGLGNLSYESFPNIKNSLRYIEKIVSLDNFRYGEQLTDSLNTDGHKVSPNETFLVPVYGPRALNGCFLVGWPEGGNSKSLLSIACQTTHSAYISQLLQACQDATNLTARECEILKALSRGLSSIKIAEFLSISPYTVNGYLQRIFLKIGVQDRTTAVLYGFANGLIR